MFFMRIYYIDIYHLHIIHRFSFISRVDVRSFLGEEGLPGGRIMKRKVCCQFVSSRYDQQTTPIKLQQCNCLNKT